MKITRSSLATAIEDVLPIVKDTFVRSMSVVCFDKDVIRANNGSVGITSKLETGLECCILGRKFYEVLSSLDEDEVEISYDGADTFKVATNGFMADVKANTNEDYPLRVKPVVELQQIPPDFKEGLQLVRFSVSKDAMRPSLCGISVDGNKIISADGYRSTRVIMETDLEKNLLIHPTVVDLMLKRDDITKYAVCDNWIHLSNEDERVIISCSLLGYVYPTDVEDAFSPTHSWVDIVFPEKLRSAVQRACIATEGAFLLDRFLTIECEGNTMKLFSESARFGKITETFKLDKEIVKFKADVNPVFFNESLALGSKVKYYPANAYLIFSTDNLTHSVAGERL